jgi:hypothetical protein
MIALLGASLFFLGCPTDSDDDDKTPEKTAAQKVGEAFGDGVEVDGTNVKLTADKTLSASTEILSDVTLKVPAGKTLTVPTGLTLTVNGTLSGEAGNGDTTAASKIVAEGSGTVTGSGLNFFDAAGDSLSSPVAAGVYVWDASADGDETAGWKQQAQAQVTFSTGEGGSVVDPISVAAGGTISLPAAPTKTGVVFGGWFTSADGEGTEFTETTPVIANITVHALWLVDQKASLTLQETANTSATNADPTGSTIEIESALLNAAKRTLKIKLEAGTFAESYVYTADGTKNYSENYQTFPENWEQDSWGPNTRTDMTPAEGHYGAVNIKGLVSAAGWNNIAVKQTNPALVLYTGSTQDCSAESFEAPVQGTAPNIWLGDETHVPVKWKFSTSAEGSVLAEDDALAVLLYDTGSLTASQKIVTLEITQYEDNTVASGLVSENDGHLLTIIIDYSDVEFVQAAP